MGRRIFVRKNGLKHKLCGFLVWFCLSHFAVAQGHYYSWDFNDCELKDILYAVSLDTGISIVADDTVCGKGDLKFAGKDFAVAFDSFLKGNRLFVEKGEVWIVSRFRFLREGDLCSLDAYDLQPNQILEKLSGGMEGVLTFDSLPAQKLTVHFTKVTESVLLESLAKRFGAYEVVSGESGYHFMKKNENRKLDYAEGNVKIEKLENGFFVDLRECKFSEAVEKLFGVDGSKGNLRSFCFLSGGDTKVQRSVFVGLDFTDTLEKLCAQNGYTAACRDGLYYIYSNASAKNELITGSKEWKKYSLRYTKPQDFLQFVNKKLGKVETIALPDEASFLCCISKEEEVQLEELISAVDLKLNTYAVHLKYIKPSDFLNHLPPGVDKNSFFLADDSTTVFFKGTESAYENLQKQIELCDQPVKRLSYDLLIIQHEESRQKNWSSSVNAGRMQAGDRNAVGAMLGSVMSFNLNVVTAFGITFAAELQSSIEDNTTKVFADTTLHGVSGKQINFQNTNTFRYRDNNVDPSTGTPIYSGVTREITSGIKLDVIGWVSGDGMITSTVTASVSRQGNDTSSINGNPPPTSEKIITTEVCGKSGEPVVLSGLIQRADTSQQKRTPFLSKIPLIGALFKAKGNTSENLQMVIYLVPHIEGETELQNEKKYDAAWAEERVKKILEKKEVECSILD